MLALLFLLCTIPAQTFEVRGPHIHVALLTHASTVAPGGTLEAGVHFTMDPGWHVYWLQPGDSGEPPGVTWRLPAGWSAGDLAWPVPRALPVPPLMNYGYEPEVLLAAPLRVAADARPGPATVAAHVRWLVCADMCIPGSADLVTSVTVGAPVARADHAAPAGEKPHDALFVRTRAALPSALPSDVQVSGGANSGGFTLRIITPRVLQHGRFFSAAGLVLEEAAEQTWHKTDGGYDLTLRASEQLEKWPAGLRGLLVYESEAGQRHGWQVDAPLPPATGAGGEGPSRPRAAPQGGSAGAGSHAFTGDGAAADGAPDNHAPAAKSLTPGRMILFALLGGIILNLMPCVFPVLSIKVMSLVRLSGHEQRAVRLHAWLYALGILVGFWVLTGALLALRAGGERIGWGFQLQSPGFVTALAVLLFMFGLSLLGVFEVGGSIMGVGQSVAGRRDAVGSFFTGLLATVVATPCSAPFMGSAVGFALTQAPWVCLAVFSALGAGLALPYVALCYLPPLARLMPKPGAWMQSVQQFMGFLLMGTVIWLLWVLERQMGSDALFVLLSLLLCLAVAAWVLGRWGHARRAVSAAAWLAILALAAVAVRQVGTMARTQSTSAASAAGLTWEKFSPERVKALRADGRRIFVDFTAAWCVSCQVNEKVVFGSAAVRKKIAEKEMVLLKADWTDADPVITEALAAFGRSGVPLYVLYGQGEATAPVQLPEVITPAMVLDALGKLP